jgi:hypothetical protein
MWHLEVEQVGEMAYLIIYVAIHTPLLGRGSILYFQKVLPIEVCRGDKKALKYVEIR